MTIQEKRTEINEAIKALEKLRDEASIADTPPIDAAIVKLEGKKELLATDRWDEYKLCITDEDFAQLKNIQHVLNDATASEESKVEKLKTGVSICKNIWNKLKALPI